MGREIEIKLPLTDGEYDKIYSVISCDEKIAGLKICKNGDVPCPIEHILKTDSYFSRYDTRQESYAAGELKHGTISLINDGTIVFAIVTDEVTKDKTISNLEEVISRGAIPIYVGTDDCNYENKIISCVKILNSGCY